MSHRDESLGTPFAIEIEGTHDAYMIRLSGAFGAECRQQFEAHLEPIVAASPSRVALDLRELTFIDSTGLAIVLKTDADLRAKEIRLVVIKGKGQVRRVFELTDTERVLTTVEDPADIPAI
jgi:anti-sigma B factor antagonist